MAQVGEGGLEPYIPPADVIDMTREQARVITDGRQAFTETLWSALLRKLSREAVDYRS